MQLERTIKALTRLPEYFQREQSDMSAVAEKAYQHNRWFTVENIFLMLRSMEKQFLQKEKIERWLSHYAVPENSKPKTVGIVMAGNIPLVGFHDFLCVLLSGHRALIKLSSKDQVLFPFIAEKLFEIDSELKDRITLRDLLKGMDAIIATGSNNSSRYFEYYFGKYPHIIRKNRSAMAVLSGDESKEDFLKLGEDIFSYFGLGCRNVSKLMVPQGYSFDFFLQSIEPYRYVMDHNKYMNNYDYNRALLLLNRTPHFNNDFLMMKEDESVFSPVAELFFEYYADEKDLQQRLLRQKENIQCVMGNSGIDKGLSFIPFGQSQFPELWDYADNVDTMQFLTTL